MEKYTEEKLRAPNSFSLFRTKELELPDSNRDILLEPVYPESYNLSYTCLLIPRFPSHQLRGDLADYLHQWLPQICISYSWSLEFIIVHPDYFQWAICVPPSTPRGLFMQQIRDDTSEMIFSTFGHIRMENLSNDFWALGNLVVLGTRPHPEEMISQYIRLKRIQQGLNTL